MLWELSFYARALVVCMFIAKEWLWWSLALFGINGLCRRGARPHTGTIQQKLFGPRIVMASYGCALIYGSDEFHYMTGAAVVMVAGLSVQKFSPGFRGEFSFLRPCLGRRVLCARAIYTRVRVFCSRGFFLRFQIKFRRVSSNWVHRAHSEPDPEHANMRLGRCAQEAILWMR